MYIIKPMNPTEVKSVISSTYLPFVDFVESINVYKTLTDNSKSDLLFGNLVQNWKLQINNGKSSFSILCGKEQKEVYLEMIIDGPMSNFIEDNNKILEYVESKHNVKLKKEECNSFENPRSSYFALFLRFVDVPVSETISSIYYEFMERSEKNES